MSDIFPASTSGENVTFDMYRIDMLINYSIPLKSKTLTQELLRLL